MFAMSITMTERRHTAGIASKRLCWSAQKSCFAGGRCEKKQRGKCGPAGPRFGAIDLYSSRHPVIATAPSALLGLASAGRSSLRAFVIPSQDHGPVVAAIAEAVIGPKPGILISRRAVSSFSAIFTIVRSSRAIASVL
jgi:hypothetical protein